MLSEQPLVSICCITYNHEHTIAQTLDSFLMQECTFPVEIVVGEDCSTDGTRAVLLRYAAQYPDRIRLLLPEQNLGPAGNFIETYKACRGAFIAFCEGDDFWTDPHKLQIQVDFLQQNPDFSTCCHTVYELRGSEQKLSSVTYEHNEGVYTVEDFARRSFIFTLSAVFRNDLAGVLPDWYKDCALPDYALHMLNGMKGKFKALNRPMAVYRVHERGMFSMKDDEKKIAAIEKTIEVLRPHFPKLIQQIFTAQMSGHYEHLIRSFYLQKNPDKAELYIRKSIDNDPETAKTLASEVLPLLIRNIYDSKRYRLGDKLISLVKKN